MSDAWMPEVRRMNGHHLAPRKRATKAELVAALQATTAALYAESGRYTTTEPTRATVIIYVR